MNASLPDDVHFPFVADLVAAGNWSALLRYFLAHQHAPALEAALGLVRRWAANHGGRWVSLADYLVRFCEDPFDPALRSRSWSTSEWQPEQLHTLQFIAAFAVESLCEVATQFPIEQQDEQFRLGIAAAEECAVLAERLKDSALVAYYRADLACAHFHMAEFELARQNCEESLQIRRALAIHRPEVYRPDVARTLGNLGMVQTGFKELESGRASIEESLRIYRLLAEQRPRPYRPEVARTLYNLGEVQDELNEFEQACESYEEALTIYRTLAQTQPDKYMRDVFDTLGNLGKAHASLNKFEQARASYNEALKALRVFFRDGTVPEHEELSGYATLLNNLGSVEVQLNDIESARSKFEQALMTSRKLAKRKPDVYLPHVAMTLNNLGNLQADADQLELARKTFEEALTLCDCGAQRHAQESAFIVERVYAYANIGQLLLRDAPQLGWPDHAAARDCFCQGVNYAEKLRGRFLDCRQRSRVQDEFLGAYEGLIECCHVLASDCGEPDALREAIGTAELCRARSLIELLADETLRPAGDPPHDVVLKLRSARVGLRRTQWSLEHERQQHPDAAAECDDVAAESEVAKHCLFDGLEASSDAVGRIWHLTRKAAECERDYQQSLREIREKYDPMFNPENPVPAPNFAAMQELLPCDVPTAIVHYTIAQRRGIALLITAGGLDSVDLPQATNVATGRIAAEWFSDYSTHRAWGHSIQQHLETLTPIAVQPVIDRLIGQGIQRLILVPNRALHVFPLHACRLSNGQHLNDAFEVIYTPSLSILHHCAQRVGSTKRDLFAICNPTNDLDGAENEIAAIEKYYSAEEKEILHAKKSTHPRSDRRNNQIDFETAKELKRYLITNACVAHAWHYAGHAMFDGDDQLESCMILEWERDKLRQIPKTRLTLRDVFTELRLPGNVLSVISGCESGLLAPDRVDEYVNLPSGFLYAGAQSVVSSLWSVHDESTQLLMGKLYDLWHGGATIGQALRAAQQWLRDDKGYKSPAIWAAFTATGLCY